jgi:hypothetical protein
MLISDDDQQTSIYIHLLCFFTLQYEYKEDTVSNNPLVKTPSRSSIVLINSIIVDPLADLSGYPLQKPRSKDHSTR